MFFKPLDLTTALRPSLLPDESLLFVQDAVGLYEGKFKIPSYQHGHAYLTSHRVCYVATDEPRKYSVSIDLRDVDRAEHQAGFLKSSAKITFFPKPQKRSLIQQPRQSTPPASSGQATQTLASRGASPNPPQTINATWVCPICSFSNPVPSNFEASASPPIPPCLACGIKPPLATILKATIAAATSRDSPGLKSTPDVQSSQEAQAELGTSEPHNLAPRARAIPSPCPRCTFLNHPSLRECEICGASLSPSGSNNGATTVGNRTESPAPFVDQTSITNRDISESIKLSFREGGDKTFYERLKSCLVQRKWLLQHAPPIPQLPQSPHRGDAYEPSPNRSGQSTPRPSAVGIAGLEQRGLESRKNTELVIGNAFEDLEALMASAKQIVSLAETLASESGISGSGGSAEASAVLSESAAALNMVTTKDMLGSGAENLYLSELSRNLAEYLTDDRTGVLRKEGGIMSLIDLWALFNRTRNGVELVSPADFEQAAQLWEKLKLPVRLRRFKSGLLVVQPSNWSDEKIIQQLDEWLQDLRQQPPSESANWNWEMYGRGITAQETAQHFGWSVGVAAEELEMAEDRGVLCREESIEGIRFWRNHFLLGGSHVELEQRILQLGL